ncbi:MAG: hypothetical protein A2Y10_00310 [Planctomycetes bacterium GWF2_41_51]|nr:MAG: hypothetical protein A2Y10_00310 [Planctomycetes bacterium GWF2_41_51]
MRIVLFSIVVFALSFNAFASYPQPAGLWQFNDSTNLTFATLGSNLIEYGSHSAVVGINANDGAVSDPLGSYYRCSHALAANGGGVYVNEWSVLMDIKVPASSIGHWASLYQTNMTNSNDGDCFVNASNRTIGVADTGYTRNAINSDTWYRIIISVDNGSFYRIYINGSPWTGATQAIDGRFALDPQILFFADDNGDDYTIICTNLAIWGQAITDAQALELGNAYNNIVIDANAHVGVNKLQNPSGENEMIGWELTDGNDWQATDRTDWHWPRTNNYYFTPGKSAHSEMSQTISLGYLASEIDNGIIAAIANGYIGGGDGDKGRIVVEYLNSSQQLLNSIDSGWIEGEDSEEWTNFFDSQFVLPAGTRFVKYRLLAERFSGTDCDAFFDDLSWEYVRVQPGNTASSTPSITGSASVSSGVSTAYTFVSTDTEAQDLSYQIDWGNEISDWSAFQASGTNHNISHTWFILGEYNVRARARDTNGAVSDWTLPYAITVTGDAAGLFLSQPFLQNPDKTAMTISWETDRPVNPTVDWGLTTSYGNNTKGLCITAGYNGSTPIYICKVRISGLSPDTTYHFRARNGSTLSTDRTFTTAPNEDKPFTFAVWGDSQMVARRLIGDTPHPEIPTAMFTDMAAMTDMAVSVGDVVDNSGYYIYTNAFRPYVCDILGRQKPVSIAFGNHDEPATSLIHKIVQNSGMRSFSFNYGNAHFTCIIYSDYVNGSLPLSWIQQDLSSDETQNATWRFLFIHVPPYCERWFDGDIQMQTYLVPLMNQYNVQMCFSGHTHEYERGMLNGTFYVISGVCSYLDIAESISEDWPFMTVGGAQNIPGLPEGGGLMHGWTEVGIDGTELNFKMHGYNLNGTYFGVLDTINFSLSDFNMDTNVNVLDLLEMADEWLFSGQSSKYDLFDRADKIINMKDLAQFANSWMFQGQF